MAKKNELAKVGTGDLMMQLRQVTNQLDPLKAKESAIKAELKARMLDPENEFQASAWYSEAAQVFIQYRSGYTRSSWNDDMLAGFALAHPGVLGCRKESETAATVAFSFKRPSESDLEGAEFIIDVDRD